MLTIILHHAALELVNKQVCDLSHKAIQNDSNRRRKAPSDILLDIAVHQSAIYPDKLHYSGRPDLIHIFLLQYHHIMKISSEEIKNSVKLFVHTKNNQIFFVPQAWRVPVHYIRFRGLMEKFLLEQEIILSEEVRLLLENENLNELIENIKPGKIINLTEKGVKTNFLTQELLTSLKIGDNTVLLIGGYQKGEIDLSKIIDKPIENIQLLEKPTTSWMILNILFSRFIN